MTVHSIPLLLRVLIAPCRAVTRHVTLAAFVHPCMRTYPSYQLLFGVASACDPAAAVVERLIRAYALRDTPMGLRWPAASVGSRVVWRGVRMTVDRAGKHYDASASGSR
ncbi:hopanoid biosynthesis associated glycosyl transferase protein HpnI [Caballeronia hypogeia]|uniref:Hopanoid biosynthesis associated glycosyl transferase protein HpnI n=1 Tax=Caballeronia hypogeia TaxID=1777140 RepID=A0A158BFC2_9BURK|nr:hypothetical protein [Caballeronia hypogeia]SAK68751.1 hopanoid biosynthesis associated glycosyl transferase protein HpnI [Caballeronia hypogeia]